MTDQTLFGKGIGDLVSQDTKGIEFVDRGDVLVYGWKEVSELTPRFTGESKGRKPTLHYEALVDGEKIKISDISWEDWHSGDQYLMRGLFYHKGNLLGTLQTDLFDVLKSKDPYHNRAKRLPGYGISSISTSEDRIIALSSLEDGMFLIYEDLFEGKARYVETEYDAEWLTGIGVQDKKIVVTSWGDYFDKGDHHAISCYHDSRNLFLLIEEQDDSWTVQTPDGSLNYTLRDFGANHVGAFQLNGAHIYIPSESVDYQEVGGPTYDKKGIFKWDIKKDRFEQLLSDVPVETMTFITRSQLEQLLKQKND